MGYHMYNCGKQTKNTKKMKKQERWVAKIPLNRSVSVHPTIYLVGYSEISLSLCFYSRISFNIILKIYQIFLTDSFPLQNLLIGPTILKKQIKLTSVRRLNQLKSTAAKLVMALSGCHHNLLMLCPHPGNIDGK